MLKKRSSLNLLTLKFLLTNKEIKTMEKINNTKMVTEQVKTFLEIVNSKDSIAIMNAVRDYTRLWKDQPELLEQYCTADKILSYLKKWTSRYSKPNK